jgi:hypothetical protein
MAKKKDPLAVELGRRGGSVKSEAKKQAARERWARYRAEILRKLKGAK